MLTSNLDRPLVFSEAKSFWDIFDEVKLWNHEKETIPPLAILSGIPYTPIGSKKPFVPTMHIGDYICFSGATRPFSLRANKIRPEVLEKLKSLLLVVDNDTTHFQICIHASTETALIIISHGQIIGSHWLAEVDIKTVPCYHEEEDKIRYRDVTMTGTTTLPPSQG